MIHIPELDEYETTISKMEFEPMKVTMKMRSPVVATDYIFLDGLISSAVFQDRVPNYFDILEDHNDLIHIPLPLTWHGVKPSVLRRKYRVCRGYHRRRREMEEEN
ncbi:MAG: hypothetical protein D4S01_09655 [Dehalococcoidia bacterium]|nr:MAG: hypothetical protein D4S01_09655 [Dehalococcoidia bacterium]